MATDNRRVVRGVRVGGRVVTDADELEREATPAQIAALAAKGYVTGDFGRGREQAGGEGSPSPDTMTKAELLEEVKRRGLKADTTMTKAEIVAVLEGGK